MADTGRDQRLAALLEAVGRDRDRTAFAELFDYFAPRIKAYMRRLGADDAQAEELMQETMLTVWRRAASYDPKLAAVSTWMFTVARNKRIDGLRRAARPDVDLNDPTMEQEQEQPDAIVGRMQTAALVREALAELPPEQAEAMRLAYYEGLSQSEIAAKLDTPLGTIKSRMRLALRRLRGSLEAGEGIGSPDEDGGD